MFVSRARFFGLMSPFLGLLLSRYLEGLGAGTSQLTVFCRHPERFNLQDRYLEPWVRWVKSNGMDPVWMLFSQRFIRVPLAPTGLAPGAKLCPLGRSRRTVDRSRLSNLRRTVGC
jgi:hypothetical protein